MGNKGPDKEEPADLHELMRTFAYSGFSTHEGYLYYQGWSLLDYSFESQVFLLHRYRYLWGQQEQAVLDAGKNR